jgi:hypothetical protein
MGALFGETMFAVEIGPKAKTNSWQGDFPEEVKCCKPDCEGSARMGFVAMEQGGIKDGEFVCDLYDNEGGKGGDFWLHDACAVAVYFCRKCLHTTSLYNQA